MRKRTTDSASKYPLKELRVLFLHGLESGMSGSKAKQLSEHFTTHVCDLQVSGTSLRKRNSFLRHGLFVMLPLILGWLFVTLIIHLFLFLHWVFIFISAFVFVFTLGFVLKAHIIRVTVARTINGCLSIVEKDIQSFSPQVIVGSSLGGALVVFLLKRRIWRGSTLICFAQHMVSIG